jgi:imidazolonepropionase-like amidohydrolase
MAMQKLSALPLLCGILLLALGAVASAQAPSNHFAVRDVRVFDGESTIENATVVVRNGRIAAVGKRVRIPAELEVIDGKGRTLLPGLIDSHVHVFPGAQADALRFGVTAELDMFNLSHEFPRWREQRDSVTPVAEADTWSAGTGMTVPGGHPNQWVPEDMPRLRSADAAAEFIDARIAEGSDYIKLIVEDNAALDAARPLPTLSRPQLCASVTAARARGKQVIAHVTTEANARMAIECGVDGLAHTIIDATVSVELVRMMKARKVFVVSTLSLLAAVPGAPPADPLAGGDARLLSASQQGSLGRTNPLVHDGQLTLALETLRRLRAAGVTVLVGTDAPAPGTAHGISMHREMALLVKAGFTPVEALTAATSMPAKTFRLGNRGKVKPGYLADLLLVEGDPTTEIADTLRIDRIWKNGFAVDRTPPAK